MVSKAKKTPIICCLLFLLLMPLSMGVSGSERRIGYRFEPIVTYSDIGDFCFGDIDGDGEQEFLRMFPSGYGFQVCNFNRSRLLGPARYQGNTGMKISDIMFGDADSKPGDELALVFRDETGDSIWIEICNGLNPKDIFCRTKPIIGKDISDRDNPFSGGWGASYSQIAFYDLDNDGEKEIITSLSVSFDLYPRGIYAYDFPSGELIWEFPTAGPPGDFTIADVDYDGFPEIFFKTWACANGAEINGRSDDSSYVFALDHQGDTLWTELLGDRFDMSTNNVLVCDCDADSTWEIYYTQLMRTEDYDRQVRVLEKRRAKDKLFIRQKSFDARNTYSEIAGFDHDGDGQSEILINNYPSVLNSQYLTTNFGGPLREHASIRQQIDIDPHLRNGIEILLVRQDSLYILNHEMMTLVEFSEPARGNIAQAHIFSTSFGTTNIVILYNMNNSGHISHHMAFYEIVPDDTYTDSTGYSTMYLIGGGVLLLIIGFVVGYGINCKCLPRRKKDRGSDIHLQNLHTILLSFEHGQMAARNLNRLVFLFSNIPESPEKLSEIRENLQSAVDAFGGYTSKQLETMSQICMKIKRLKEPAKKISRNCRDLSAIFGTESGKDILSVTRGSLAKDIPIISEDIISLVREFKAYLASHLSVDLYRVVPDVLKAFSGRMKQEGIVLKEVTGSGLLNHKVFFPEAEFAAIIEELLSNAFRSMESSIVKEISIVATVDGGEVEMTIKDTGCGFPGDNPAEAFEKGVSKRGKEGGLGLFLVRQQVERFSGRIRLQNNTEGEGATVYMVLKTVNYD